MTSTALRASADETGPPRLGPARRRIHVPTVLLGALLVVGSALAFAVVAQRLTAQQPVLVLSRPVDRGTALTESDLAVARVGGGDGVAFTAVADRDRLIGRPLLTTLPAGSVVTADLVGPPGLAVGSSTQTVGLLLEPGGYPTTSLAPGDRVAAITTSGRGERVTDAVVVSSEAVVEGAATRLVSIAIDEDAAAAIATAAANDQVRLVLDGVAP